VANFADGIQVVITDFETPPSPIKRHLDGRVRAFELLTKLSQASNIRVAEIAEEIVSRGGTETVK
jgi:hypothetical protein